MSLPKNGALVEFVKFPVFDFKTGGWKPERYVAFVVPHGEALLKLVDLGEAEGIEALITTFLEPFTGDKTRAPRKNEALFTAHQTPQETLKERAFPPALQSALGSATHIRLAPDGALAGVPFDLLLGEDYQLVYYTSGRDAVTEANSIRATGETLLMTDPDYGTTLFAKSERVAVSAARRGKTAAREDNSSPVGRGPRGGLDTERNGIGRLPAGILEAEATAPYFGVTPLSGFNATVEHLL